MDKSLGDLSRFAPAGQSAGAGEVEKSDAMMTKHGEKYINQSKSYFLGQLLP